MNTINQLGISLLLLTLILVLNMACEEIPPFELSEVDTTTITDPIETGTTIDTIYQDSTFVDVVFEAQEKIVVMEEFSGVRCVTCPAGHEQTEAILTANKGRVVTAVIHAGNLIFPYNGEEPLFIDDGLNLYNQLAVEAVPAASFDRLVFDGERSAGILNPNTWAAKVNQRLEETTPVNVYIYHTYDPNSRSGQIFVQLRYTEDVAEDHRVTIMLTESRLIRTQLTPSGEEKDYIQNHVMRSVPSSINGTLIDQEKKAGTAIIQSFDYALDPSWQVDQMEIIGFVSGADGIILQGGKDHL